MSAKTCQALSPRLAGPADRPWGAGIPIEALRQRLRDAGAAPVHEAHVLRAWAQGRPFESGRSKADDFLPRTLRAALDGVRADLAALATLELAQASADGATRLLLRLADGQNVESVLLPRNGVCVSTQVGCAVGCVFCMTGRGGLVRQLGSAEIVAQVVLARTLQPVRKVVFMGMGEPAHNLDNVLDAIALLGHEGGIGHKQLVFSTVGDARVFERLAQTRVQPALALSLHSTDAALRAELLPRAPRSAPARLLAAAVDYARDSGYPLQLQWTLLAGVNDGDAEFERLADWLAPHRSHAMLNLIPYNTVDGLPYARPAWERALAIARRMQSRGVLTRLRRSAGQDVDGGCGQLRVRAVAEGNGSRTHPAAHGATHRV